jgi:hypothetical protein
MLRTVFATHEGGSLFLGVFSELRFDRKLLRPSAGGKPVAELREHSWRIDGQAFQRLECDGRVVVYFGEADGRLGPVYGPFGQLSSMDGVIFANRARFAIFDEATGVWAIENTELRCPVLVARTPD